MLTDRTSPADRARFEAAIRRFDEENAKDPNLEAFQGASRPKELLYAEWLTDWVLRLCPEASEELRLAARCQHLCRWLIPRNSFPTGRAGYLKWREALKRFHAEKAGEILRETGYEPETIRRVQDLNLKRHFPSDPESRVIEDALCLVFLERQFGALAGKTPEDKMIGVLQKSWKKMTPMAQELAMKIEYAPREKELIGRAIGK